MDKQLRSESWNKHGSSVIQQHQDTKNRQNNRGQVQKTGREPPQLAQALQLLLVSKPLHHLMPEVMAASSLAGQRLVCDWSALQEPVPVQTNAALDVWQRRGGKSSQLFLRTRSLKLCWEPGTLGATRAKLRCSSARSTSRSS